MAGIGWVFAFFVVMAVVIASLPAVLWAWLWRSSMTPVSSLWLMFVAGLSLYWSWLGIPGIEKWQGEEFVFVTGIGALWAVAGLDLWVAWHGIRPASRKPTTPAQDPT